MSFANATDDTAIWLLKVAIALDSAATWLFSVLRSGDEADFPEADLS